MRKRRENGGEIKEDEEEKISKETCMDLEYNWI
jgi:hypothetical protein